MNKEFAQLHEREYQKEFLSDWWSEKKLFRGRRQTGKSTLMLCEAKRFSECGFDVLFLSQSELMCDNLKSEYQGLFGERPTFDFSSYSFLEKGRNRGMMKDVVILDEFQNTTLETYNREIAPMKPKFVRASACNTMMENHHWLMDAGSKNSITFFDSIYED